MATSPSPFAKDLATPQAWLETAEQLFYSLSLLEPEIRKQWQRLEDQMFRNAPRPQDFIEPARIQSVFMMLCSFGIENLLKSSIVAKETASILAQAKSGRLPDALDEHNLVLLAGRAGFKPNPDQEQLLRNLTENALWFGRYPITSNAKNYTTVRTMSDGSETFVGTWAEDDIDSSKRLVQSIADSMHFTIPWAAAC